jgi:hypothetical protein
LPTVYLDPIIKPHNGFDVMHSSNGLGCLNGNLNGFQNEDNFDTNLDDEKLLSFLQVEI